MKILLVDVDSTWPNMAICQLYTYHLKLGDTVTLHKMNHAGYPTNKPELVDATGYDRVYVSVVFSYNADKFEVQGCSDVQIGGSGIDLHSILPPEIANQPLDYTIYSDYIQETFSGNPKRIERELKNLNKFTYDFITRGCIRNCNFCVVPKKEGGLRLVKELDDILDNPSYSPDKTLMLMDNNFLAYAGHKDILKDLAERDIRCCFSQGLDIRLITEENAMLLNELNYHGEYTFAFDNIKLLPIIEKKLDLLHNMDFKGRLRFFVFVSPEHTNIEDDIFRIKFLRERGILPYVMRHFSCWSSENRYFYTDIAGYCNMPSAFKRVSFEDFLFNQTSGPRRKSDLPSLQNSLDLWLPESGWPGDNAYKEVESAGNNW